MIFSRPWKPTQLMIFPTFGSLLLETLVHSMWSATNVNTSPTSLHNSLNPPRFFLPVPVRYFLFFFSPPSPVSLAAVGS